MIKKPVAKTKKSAPKATVEVVEEFPGEGVVITEEVALEAPAAVEFDGKDKVGDVLRKRRLALGYKVPEMAKALCIRKSYVDAIESGNYAALPEAPYGLGFVRSYASFLGLNPVAAAEAFKREMTDGAAHGEDYSALEPQEDISAPSHKYLLASLAGIAAIYLAWLAFGGFTGAAREEPEADGYGDAAVSEIYTDGGEGAAIRIEDYPEVMNQLDGASPDAHEHEGEAGGAATEGTSAEAPAAASAAEYIELAPAPGAEEGVKVVATKEVWVEVKDKAGAVDGGKVWISKVLRPGEVYKLPKRKDLLLSVGVPEGVEVYVDGKPAEVVKPAKRMNIPVDF